MVRIGQTNPENSVYTHRKPQPTLSPSFQTIVGVALFAFGLLGLAKKRDTRLCGGLMLAGTVITLTSFRASKQPEEGEIKPSFNWGGMFDIFVSILRIAASSSEDSSRTRVNPSSLYGKRSSFSSQYSSMNSNNFTSANAQVGCDAKKEEVNSNPPQFSSMNSSNFTPANAQVGCDAKKEEEEVNSNPPQFSSMNSSNFTPANASVGCDQ